VWKASDPVIGSTATFAAVLLPDALLSYGGKLVFALVTAALTSVVSTLISNRLRKRSK
jgi:hypothetical protein